MGILDWLGGGRSDALDVKASKGQAIHFVSGSEARWAPRNYASFALEAYQLNVVGYRAVNRIADAVASVGWSAWRGEDELDNSPYLEMVTNPNPSQSMSEYWREQVGYLLLAGNSYEEIVEVGGAPKELWNLRPDRTQIKVNKSSGDVKGFEYGAGGAKVLFAPEEVLHTQLFNPLDDLYGQSPVEAGAYSVDQHNEAMKWVQALLQNSARPSGALIHKSETELSDDNYNRLKAQMEENYQGASNAGRPLLLDGGLDWVQMGLDPSNMGIVETKNSAARDISLAFGVPPQLLGIPGDNTYSNYQEARLAFWEDTVLPLLTFLAEKKNQRFSPVFGGVEIKPVLDEIPAIVDKRAALWEMADASDDLTLNEARKLKGYEPIEDERGEMLMADIRRTKAPESQEGAEELLSKMVYGR